ncbi:MAG: 3-methyl-2-oxobutanoate dehydrogenase subunit beta [Deltaproteobacteria bacterium]|nr:3-methyl-2-oxobutanoate dehydrogenase subunit beta [Deltaproteobacteria bacterium]
MPIELPDFEGMTPGHLACAGCGAAVAMRFVLKGLGDRAILVLPACCWTIIGGPFPYSALRVPVLHTAFETGGAAASGVRAALDRRGDTETQVVTWAGDGGTFDIGLQALSGAAERDENILYVCYDNEAYMNTGVQGSSATPYGAWTTTTPTGSPKRVRKKDIVGILAAHRIPYAATASIAYPEDLVRKVQRAASVKGTKFLHVYATCPTGWKVPSEVSIRLARLAVQTRTFPLYEVERGERYTINVEPVGYLVDEYLKAQGRFSHLVREDLDVLQRDVDHCWERLKALARLS